MSLDGNDDVARFEQLHVLLLQWSDGQPTSSFVCGHWEATLPRRLLDHYRLGDVLGEGAA